MPAKSRLPLVYVAMSEQAAAPPSTTARPQSSPAAMSAERFLQEWAHAPEPLQSVAPERLTWPTRTRTPGGQRP